MKYKISDETFRENRELSEHIQAWVELQDIPMSVRRVFYAMVTQGVIDNTHAQYRKVSGVLLKLRRGGWLDWDHIIDDTRGSHKTAEYENAEACVKAALKRFRLDRWKDQENCVEVWVEKRGHVSALFEITDTYDVPIVENGGRKALTYEQVEPLLVAQTEGKKNVVLYVGDYDPSGLQMDENMIQQLNSWGVVGEWTRVALTLEQVQAMEIPRAYTVPDTASDSWWKKNPGAEVVGHDKSGRPLVNKLEKDPNAKWFKDNHGGELFQVEVDAIEVPALRELVREAIKEHLNPKKYDAVLKDEKEQRENMEKNLGFAS